MIRTVLRTFGLALRSDLEHEHELTNIMEATIASYSSGLDRLTEENKKLHAQNMNLVRDGVAAWMGRPPYSGGAERVRESLERMREDRERFNATLNRIYERGRAERGRAAVAAPEAAKLPGDNPPLPRDTANGRSGIDPATFGGGAPTVISMSLPPQPVLDVPEEPAVVVPLPRSPRKRKTASQVGPIKTIGGE